MRSVHGTDPSGGLHRTCLPGSHRSGLDLIRALILDGLALIIEANETTGGAMLHLTVGTVAAPLLLLAAPLTQLVAPSF